MQKSLNLFYCSKDRLEFLTLHYKKSFQISRNLVVNLMFNMGVVNFLLHFAYLVAVETTIDCNKVLCSF